MNKKQLISICCGIAAIVLIIILAAEFAWSIREFLVSMLIIAACIWLIRFILGTAKISDQLGKIHKELSQLKQSETKGIEQKPQASDHPYRDELDELKVLEEAYHEDNPEAPEAKEAKQAALDELEESYLNDQAEDPK